MSEPAVILDYANGTFGQPLGSLFAVERLPDGVRLARPVSPPWGEVVLAAVIGALTLAFSLGCVAHLVGGSERHRPDEWARMVSVLVALVVVACGCVGFAWQFGRCRTLTITIRGRAVTIERGVLTLGGRPWRTRRRCRFSVSLGQPEFPTFRVVAMLRVTVWFGLARTVMHALPREECVWAARLLNDVLDAGQPG